MGESALFCRVNQSNKQPYITVTYIPFTAKRLKDTGISGWWVFLLFVPFGQLIVSVLALMPTDRFKKTTEPA
ncbi:DUF805 domain-containing protein [Idiomarina abyssalis]|uniref:DUF805 domain-containing protein n=1 Tax=Idiomarina abyssalis TaxID=86102 RepID=UPI003A5C05DC